MIVNRLFQPKSADLLVIHIKLWVISLIVTSVIIRWLVVAMIVKLLSKAMYPTGSFWLYLKNNYTLINGSFVWKYVCSYFCQ